MLGLKLNQVSKKGPSCERHIYETDSGLMILKSGENKSIGVLFIEHNPLIQIDTSYGTVGSPFGFPNSFWKFHPQ